jgi:hypothetical protein
MESGLSNQSEKSQKKQNLSSRIKSIISLNKLQLYKKLDQKVKFSAKDNQGTAFVSRDFFLGKRSHEDFLASQHEGVQNFGNDGSKRSNGTEQKKTAIKHAQKEKRSH